MSEVKEKLIKSEEEYLEILELSYDQAIKKLSENNGKPDFNYFTKGSYDLFKNDISRKRINFTAGYRKRRKKGYQIHHILENKFENLSYPSKIRCERYPFCTQKAENLVYVDSTEHAILHTLIANETEGSKGICAAKSLMKKSPENVKSAIEKILDSVANNNKSE